MDLRIQKLWLPHTRAALLYKPISSSTWPNNGHTHTTGANHSLLSRGVTDHQTTLPAWRLHWYHDKTVTIRHMLNRPRTITNPAATDRQHAHHATVHRVVRQPTSAQVEHAKGELDVHALWHILGGYTDTTTETATIQATSHMLNRPRTSTNLAVTDHQHAHGAISGAGSQVARKSSMHAESEAWCTWAVAQAGPVVTPVHKQHIRQQLPRPAEAT